MNDYAGTPVLVVDDDQQSRELVQRILNSAGYVCGSAQSAAEARAALAVIDYPIVLCDVSMPGESGIELVASLQARQPEVVVVMMSGYDDPELASMAVRRGAYGYLVKPFSANELTMTFDNALHRRRLELESRAVHLTLQQQVAERTLDLTVALQDLEASRREIIRRLARAVEQRDSDTGAHIERIGNLSAFLAQRCGLPPDRVELIRTAAPMHDVGKLGVSDAILRKPGPLSDAERAEMQLHTEIGHSILAGSGIELLELAAVIALSHHERWDGGGYPHGLGGPWIPLEGRIVAVADVYDALSSDRCYRAAMPREVALQMVLDGAGTHFDPQIARLLPEFIDT